MIAHLPMGFVDLHSHVLPGLDDGVASLPESLDVLDVLAGAGFEIVCATPHQKVGSWVPTAQAMHDAWSTVNAALDGKRPALELRLGAENFWDELFLERSLDGQQPAYTGGRAFLVEVPPSATPPRLEDQLFRMRTRGLLPVLAHPERYHSLCRQPDRLTAIARTCALVVDLGALDGAHGPVAGEAAQRLVREGRAHACASDAHDVDDARAAAAGIAWIERKLGHAALTRLLDENPRRILQGELPD
jgi:protein-tyrosine phosphatase